MARELDASRPIVYKALALLEENEVVKKIELGWHINPNIVFNPQEAKKKNMMRLDVLHSYYGHEKYNTKKESTTKINKAV